MTVLVMETHIDVADHHAALQKLGVFAAARGWTVNDNLQDVQWQSGSGFVSGSESYLEIESPSPNQTLHFRFRGEATGADPDHEWLQIGAFKAGATLKDTASGTHPVQRANPGGIANWNPNRFFSMKPTTIPKIWFFGNSTFLLMVVQYDSTYIQMLAFGSVEIFDSTETEGNYAGYVNTTTSVGDKWYSKNNIVCFDKDGGNFLYEGGQVLSSNEFNTLRFQSNNLSVSEFVPHGELIAKNAYSTIRPCMKPTIYIKKSDGRTFPLGTFPIFRIDTTDYAIGEVIEYGSVKMVCFPNGLISRVKGVAVQIAS